MTGIWNILNIILTPIHDNSNKIRRFLNCIFDITTSVYFYSSFGLYFKYFGCGINIYLPVASGLGSSPRSWNPQDPIGLSHGKSDRRVLSFVAADLPLIFSSTRS